MREFAPIVRKIIVLLLLFVCEDNKSAFLLITEIQSEMLIILLLNIPTTKRKPKAKGVFLYPMCISV